MNAFLFENDFLILQHQTIHNWRQQGKFSKQKNEKDNPYKKRSNKNCKPY